MKLQAYNDGTVHLFYRDNPNAVCSFHISPPLKPLIQERLKLLHMKRKTKWEDYQWGSETYVGFIT